MKRNVMTFANATPIIHHFSDLQTYLSFIDARTAHAKSLSLDFFHGVVTKTRGEEIFITGTKTPSPDLAKIARRVFAKECKRGEHG